MPHEVIMPALGMAQETGRIVAWLKEPGDEVAAGEALMEVETDKAVMEVEAQVAGFLGRVRAKAGDDVPVGDVIAVIADSAEEAEGADEPAEAAPVVSEAPAEDPAPPAKIDGHDIIMPALGMAQSTGRIVAWLKAPGDPVAADDVLLEVETDKSTVEVPAGADGFVAALLAGAEQDVPVGEVIAVISSEKPDAPVQRRARDAGDTAAPPADRSPETPVARRQAVEPRTDGRILSSPKVRRLAAEEGLDLGRLVAAGHPQPYHVADLEVLRSLPEETPEAVTPAGMAAQVDQITARVPRSGVAEFLRWMLEDGGIEIAPSALFLRFAAAALRRAEDSRTGITLAVHRLGETPQSFLDPDLTRLSQTPRDAAEAPADLLLRDLSETALTTLRMGDPGLPTLCLGSDADSYVVTFDFPSGRFDEDTAVAIVTGFAHRLADPLHHLL